MPTEVTRPLVVIADPDTECTALTARQIEWAGYGVLTAGDGAGARALVEEFRPEALVIEAVLGDTSGYELVRELRAVPHNRLMPIVMVSARAGKLDRDFAFTVGADEYVRKPFRSVDVVSRLARLVPSGPRPVAPAVSRSRRTLRPLAQPALALR